MHLLLECILQLIDLLLLRAQLQPTHSVTQQLQIHGRNIITQVASMALVNCTGQLHWSIALSSAVHCIAFIGSTVC